VHASQFKSNLKKIEINLVSFFWPTEWKQNVTKLTTGGESVFLFLVLNRWYLMEYAVADPEILKGVGRQCISLVVIYRR